MQYTRISTYILSPLVPYSECVYMASNVCINYSPSRYKGGSVFKGRLTQYNGKIILNQFENNARRKFQVGMFCPEQ